MLIPDSLASLEASSTRSVGQPSTITTTTLGAPPRFPLASKKKFLLTNESAFPAIEEELRRSYRSGSTLSDNIPWNNRQRADSSVGGCGELGKAVSVAVWAGEETTATGASASCTEHPPLCLREAGDDELGYQGSPKHWWELPARRQVCPTACDGFAVPGDQHMQVMVGAVVSHQPSPRTKHFWSQPLYPVRRCGLATAQTLKPSLSWGCASSPITYQHWKVPLSVEFSQWHSLDPWSWHKFLG